MERRQLHRRHFFCNSCLTFCAGHHAGDCPCCYMSRGFIGLLLFSVASGFVGATLGYYLAGILIPLLIMLHTAGIKTLASVPWMIKVFLLPAITIPTLNISRILHFLLSLGFIGGILFGLCIGLIYIFLVRSIRCDRCGRPLIGSAVVTMCRTCHAKFCFDCCFREIQ